MARTKFIGKIKAGLYSFEIALVSVLASIYKVIYNKPKWLVGERPDTAQDNGICFYNYLRSEHPQTKAYYIIDKKSVQIKNLHESIKIIQYNSLKHKIFFLICHYYVTSHNHFCFPISIIGKKRYKIPSKTKNIFLQHGITLNDNSYHYGKDNSSISIFICGAKPEFEFIKSTFGYSTSEVYYTGFARFDGLNIFSVQNKILLMPTWRREIVNKKPGSNHSYFLKSNYYKIFQSLINNKKLIEILDQFNYQLIFYPHYEIQPFLHHFSTSGKRIILANKEEFNVQELLKSAKLLITDTSSVSFDFAYMYKPLIYYFFDSESFYNTHVEKGYFDHKSMGFGKLIEQEKPLISLIENYLQNGCFMEELYKNRVRNFFPLQDSNNCERIYTAILES
jgi:CDP-glycerol glycerophosphotransferase